VAWDGIGALVFIWYLDDNDGIGDVHQMQAHPLTPHLGYLIDKLGSYSGNMK